MRLHLVALAVLAFPAFANITSSSLTGHVTINGAPASGVTVTVTSTAAQAPRVGVTNAHGRYWLDALPPGTYDVTFSLAAHTSLTKRAVLELARVARVDGALEPSPDEDSTTSTATTVGVAETIFPTTHFGNRALDRLPAGRIGSAFLAPGFPFAAGFIDGNPTGVLTSEDTIEQLTVVTGASPVEWETDHGLMTAMLTRSGGEDFFFTLRDTYRSNDDVHFGEATAGGRIVSQRLWFFAAGWHDNDFDGVFAKLQAQLGRAHHIDASYVDGNQDSFGRDTPAARYTAAIGPRFTSEVFATEDFVSGRASYHAGDHVMSAGLTSGGGVGPNYDSIFASDRWSYAKWNVYAGLRRDDSELGDHLSPRIGVSYDLHGNGARAIIATFGEYAIPSQPHDWLRVLSLGFASAIGNSGRVRGDAIRRTSGDFWTHDLQVDARYRLFDRFEAGGTYTLHDTKEAGGPRPIVAEQNANMWLSAELPAGSHEFGATVLQRYAEFSSHTLNSTDVALRYAIPLSRVRMLLAADTTNVFRQGNTTLLPREVRLWLRLRL